MKNLVSATLPLLAALSFGCFFVAPAASAAPTIVNGSFESPPYPAGTVNRGGGDGWISSFMGGVSIISGNIFDNGGHAYGVTPYGQQYLGIDPRTPTGFISRDSQGVDGFVAGQTYQLTLEAADSDGGLAPVLNVNFNDGSEVNYFDHDFALPVGGPYGDVIQFNPLTVKFTAPVSGMIYLAFTNVGTGGDPGSISVDDVHLVPTSGPGLRLKKTFNYPAPRAETVASGINTLGTVVGLFDSEDDGTRAGYVRSPDGTFSAPIVDPLDTSTPSNTDVSGLNDAGTLCGSYINPADGLRHGFVRADGTFADFTLPGPISTGINAINNAGDFVGFSNAVGTYVGQAFTHIGGVTATLQLPPSTASSAAGINDADDVVGFYIDNASLTHGFFRHAASGKTESVDYPGARTTTVTGVNNQGDLSGYYDDETGHYHAFVRKGRSIWLTYDQPGALDTYLYAINDHGTATGEYRDAAFHIHALIVQGAQLPPH